MLRSLCLVGDSEFPRPVEAVNPRRLAVSHCGEGLGETVEKQMVGSLKTNELPSAEKRR